MDPVISFRTCFSTLVSSAQVRLLAADETSLLKVEIGLCLLFARIKEATGVEKAAGTHDFSIHCHTGNELLAEPLKRQTKIAADDILIFYFYLLKKIRLDFFM